MTIGQMRTNRCNWSEVAAHGHHRRSSPSRNNDQGILRASPRPRPERNLCQLRFFQGRGVASMGTVMANSATWVQLSSFDDWDYRQALVLHEAFDDSRVSPRMEAVLERLRAKGRRSFREAA